MIESIEMSNSKIYRDNQLKLEEYLYSNFPVFFDYLVVDIKNGKIILFEDLVNQIADRIILLEYLFKRKKWYRELKEQILTGNINNKNQINKIIPLLSYLKKNYEKYYELLKEQVFLGELNSKVDIEGKILEIKINLLEYLKLTQFEDENSKIKDLISDNQITIKEEIDKEISLFLKEYINSKNIDYKEELLNKVDDKEITTITQIDLAIRLTRFLTEKAGYYDFDYILVDYVLKEITTTDLNKLKELNNLEFNKIMDELYINKEVFLW